MGRVALEEVVVEEHIIHLIQILHGLIRMEKMQLILLEEVEEEVPLQLVMEVMVVPES